MYTEINRKRVLVQEKKLAWKHATSLKALPEQNVHLDLRKEQLIVKKNWPQLYSNYQTVCVGDYMFA